MSGRPQSHCSRGHEMKAPNLYIDPQGNRRCRECRTTREQNRQVERVEFVCPSCGDLHSKSPSTVRKAREDYLSWCRSCIMIDLAERRNAERRARIVQRPAPTFGSPAPRVVVDTEWRTLEEREPFASYWTERYTPEEIRDLAGGIAQVLDADGSPARKRNRNATSKLRRAA